MANVKTTKKTNKKVLMMDGKPLPKRVKLESYSCIWKIYLVTDPKTKEQHKKRFWIVIGDRHKRYRKFETQAEAIQYFRALKKYAKMRVKSTKTNKFFRTIYTFFEMIWRGASFDEIKATTTRTTTQHRDDEDYEDEYSQFDTNEFDEDDFDEEEINRVLAESEKDMILIEEDEDEEYTPVPVKRNHPEEKYVTEILDLSSNDKKPKNENQKTFELRVDEDEKEQVAKIRKEEKPKQKQQIQKPVTENETEIDPYYVTTEVVFESNNQPVEEKPKQQVQKPVIVEVIEKEEVNSKPSSNNFDEDGFREKNLYDLVLVGDIMDELENSFGDIEEEQDKNDDFDDEFNITQHDTSLTPAEENEEYDDEIKYRNKPRTWFWIVFVFIVLVLAAIVVLALIYTNVINV